MIIRSLYQLSIRSLYQLSIISFYQLSIRLLYQISIRSLDQLSIRSTDHQINYQSDNHDNQIIISIINQIIISIINYIIFVHGGASLNTLVHPDNQFQVDLYNLAFLIIIFLSWVDLSPLCGFSNETRTTQDKVGKHTDWVLPLSMISHDFVVMLIERIRSWWWGRSSK